MRLLRWEALCAIVAFALDGDVHSRAGPLCHGALHVHRPAALRDRGDWVSAQGEG